MTPARLSMISLHLRRIGHPQRRRTIPPPRPSQRRRNALAPTGAFTQPIRTRAAHVELFRCQVFGFDQFFIGPARPRRHRCTCGHPAAHDRRYGCGRHPLARHRNSGGIPTVINVLLGAESFGFPPHGDKLFHRNPQIATRNPSNVPLGELHNLQSDTTPRQLRTTAPYGAPDTYSRSRPRGPRTFAEPPAAAEFYWPLSLARPHSPSRERSKTSSPPFGTLALGQELFSLSPLTASLHGHAAALKRAAGEPAAPQAGPVEPRSHSPAGDAIYRAGIRKEAKVMCPEGCYKHFVNGRWICCKCGQ